LTRQAEGTTLWAERTGREGVLNDFDHGNFSAETVYAACLWGWYRNDGFVSFLFAPNLRLGGGYEPRTCRIELGAALVELFLQYTPPLGRADGCGSMVADRTAGREFTDIGVVLVHQRCISTDDPTAVATQNRARIACVRSTGCSPVTLGDGVIVISAGAAWLKQSSRLVRNLRGVDANTLTKSEIAWMRDDYRATLEMHDMQRLYEQKSKGI
jgi:hypothetical protein